MIHVHTSEEFDTQIVDGDDCDEKYCNEDPRIDRIAVDPILDDQCGSSKLIGCDNDVCRMSAWCNDGRFCDFYI